MQNKFNGVQGSTSTAKPNNPVPAPRKYIQCFSRFMSTCKCCFSLVVELIYVELTCGLTKYKN